MAFLAVVFDQWLNRDITVATAGPVGGKASGGAVIALQAGAMDRIFAIERVGLPAGVGAVEVGVVAQYAEQDRVDLLAPQFQRAVVGYGRGKGVGHGARRIEGTLQLGLDDCRPGLREVLHLAHCRVLDQCRNFLVDESGSRVGRVETIEHQRGGGQQQAQAGGRANACLQRTKSHGAATSGVFAD
ncbi:hypothetical protein FQZ97_1038920 [compost metagenome]